jgi:phosphoglycolate phosphatase-like HAD superfamily hydrolase
MIPMMVDILAETGTAETRTELYQQVEEFVMRLNGRQTIYQMIQLADEVKKRGGVPAEPLAYKHRYHEMLWREVGARVESVRRRQIPPNDMTVPGSYELLRRLCDAGLTLYLASGTDLTYVRDELDVLGLSDYFGEHVYGALDDYKKFSKAMIIERMIRDMHLPGEQVIGFGDGFVEIEEMRKIGGLAVGVASNEAERRGINAWKRNRLIKAGAHIIIGDYRQLDELIETIGLEGDVE